jgi:hypothetical protein
MKNVLESLGLRVKLPMVLETDNQEAVYLANNWSIGGRTRHIYVRSVFLRELKEAGVLVSSARLHVTVCVTVTIESKTTE